MEPWITINVPIPPSAEDTPEARAARIAEIEAARPPEMALGLHAYPHPDYPG